MSEPGVWPTTSSSGSVVTGSCASSGRRQQGEEKRPAGGARMGWHGDLLTTVRRAAGRPGRRGRQAMGGRAGLLRRGAGRGGRQAGDPGACVRGEVAERDGGDRRRLRPRGGAAGAERAAVMRRGRRGLGLAVLADHQGADALGAADLDGMAIGRCRERRQAMREGRPPLQRQQQGEHDPEGWRAADHCVAMPDRGRASQPAACQLTGAAFRRSVRPCPTTSPFRPPCSTACPPCSGRAGC